MVRYLFYTIGDLTYQSPLVVYWEEGMFRLYKKVAVVSFGTGTANDRIFYPLEGRWRNIEYLYNDNWKGKTDVI